MARVSEVVRVSPGQASWIVERLVADGRLTRADVARILADMNTEIATLEQRLAALRGAVAAAPSGSAPSPRASVPTQKQRGTRRKARPARKGKGHPRGIAGTLAVLLRSIPAAQHAAIQAVRAEKGIPAAINAARVALKT